MSNKNVKTKIKNAVWFTIVKKKIEFSDVSVAKHVYDLYPDNYKMLMKEIKDDLNKWKYIQCSDWKIQHRKYVNYSHMIYRFNVIPIKIPGRFFL